MTLVLQIRKLAIDELDKMKSLSFLEKLMLAKVYHIYIWMVEGYVKIVANWEAIQKHWTLNELGELLGWKTIARVMELVGRAKESPKPVQSTLKVTMKCPACRMAVSISNLPNPVKKVIELPCPECQKPISKLIPSVKDFDHPRPSVLRGEALVKAVQVAFKDELSLCTN